MKCIPGLENTVAFAAIAMLAATSPRTDPANRAKTMPYWPAIRPVTVETMPRNIPAPGEPKRPALQAAGTRSCGQCQSEDNH